MDNVELVTELRHELHAHPELSNQEVWTRRRLIDFLHAHTRNLEREVIERERVDEVYAFHNWSRMEAGTVNVIDGPTMPASRGLVIAFHGKTSHAAEPVNSIENEKDR